MFLAKAILNSLCAVVTLLETRAQYITLFAFLTTVSVVILFEQVPTLSTLLQYPPCWLLNNTAIIGICN